MRPDSLLHSISFWVIVACFAHITNVLQKVLPTIWVSKKIKVSKQLPVLWRQVSIVL